MADLVLDEQRVPAVLDQVGDIGAAQRVEVQPRGQAERVPVGGEPAVQLLTPIRGAAFGRPQRRRVRSGGQQRPDLVDPLVQHLGQPRPDGQHAAPFRAASPSSALPYRTWHTP